MLVGRANLQQTVPVEPSQRFRHRAVDPIGDAQGDRRRGGVRAKRPRRRPWAGVACLSVLVLAAAGACERDGGLNYPTVAATGPTENCPDNRITGVNTGGMPTPDAVRCSYRDAHGEGQSKLRGSVYGEQPGTFPGVPLEAVNVTVHEIDKDGLPGKQVARAQTNPQGHFTLAAMLPADTYLIIARDEAGKELGRTTIVSDDRNPELPKVQILVPMDPAMRERARAAGTQNNAPDGGAAGEDPAPSSQPRGPDVEEGDAKALELSPR